MRIGYEETVLRDQVKQIRGILRPRQKLWELIYAQIEVLELQDRIVPGNGEIDPIRTLAILAAITSNLTSQPRRKTAQKALLYASIVLVGLLVVGQILLSAMGIWFISLQVAGGMILFLFGLQMIFSSTFANNSEQGEPGHDIAVFPLAVPSIATSGAIMAIIVLIDNHFYTIPAQLGATVILLSILGVTYLFAIRNP